MNEPKVFLVHLRRPVSASKRPNEGRDDPFYEFGSFGSTPCHRKSLMHPRHAEALAGARLAFAQGGRLGHRLVFLTPPVTVHLCSDHCEVRWLPGEMPFKYDQAPVLVWKDGDSDFPLIEAFADDTDRSILDGIEAGFSSLFRSRCKPLEPEQAEEAIQVYEQKRAQASQSAIAAVYYEALPWCPPRCVSCLKARPAECLSCRKQRLEAFRDRASSHPGGRLSC